MNHKLEELLYDALVPVNEPDPGLNRRILESRSKEVSAMRKFHFRKMAAAAAVCVLAVGSVTAYAAYQYLSPSQVAKEVSNNNALAKAFESKDAVLVNETQTSGDYEITLLGLVSGAELSPYVDKESTGELERSRTYAAAAIARTDGKKITEDERKCVSPLLTGVDWMVANNGTMDVGLCWFIKDGVIYAIMDCDNLEMFAARGVQVGVVDEFGDEPEAFFMDKKTGVYSKKPGYKGTNALFSLPLDQAKADEKAADEYIEKLKKPSDDEEDEDEITGDADFEKYVRDFEAAEDKAAFLKETAVLISRKVLKIDKDGMVEFGKEGEAQGTMDLTGYKEGVPTFGLLSGSNLDDTVIHMFTVNGDGTATYETYAPAVK